PALALRTIPKRPRRVGVSMLTTKRAAWRACSRRSAAADSLITFMEPPPASTGGIDVLAPCCALLPGASTRHAVRRARAFAGDCGTCESTPWSNSGTRCPNSGEPLRDGRLTLALGKEKDRHDVPLLETFAAMNDAELVRLLKALGDPKRFQMVQE